MGDVCVLAMATLALSARPPMPTTEVLLTHIVPVPTCILMVVDYLCAGAVAARPEAALHSKVIEFL